MEACGSAHHWARWLQALGIEVRCCRRSYVRAYVQAQQDRCGRCLRLLEAARCADIQPVQVKSVEQQALQALHRTRSLWMGTRTSRINALRGFCREFGIVIAQGARTGLAQIARVLADPNSSVPALLRGTMRSARGDPAARGAHRAAGARARAELARNRRLHNAAVDPRRRPAHRTAMVAATSGDVSTSSDARHFASWFGLTPKEHSLRRHARASGASPSAATATCACCSPTAHARVLHAATVARQTRGRHRSACDAGRWHVQPRTNHNKATCALANKLARICYATLRDDEPYGAARLNHKIERDLRDAA